MKRSLRVALLLLAAVTSPLSAQQHFPSNEDLRNLRAVSSPILSPDLKHVVVVLQDSTAQGGKTHLWLLHTDDTPYRQLTFGPDASPDASKDGSKNNSKGERSPEYLPDGSTILFLADHDGKSTLYHLPLDGGEAAPIKLERVPAPGDPAASVSVVSFSISPDGNTIAVIAADPEPAARTRDNKDKKDILWVEHQDLKHHLYLLNSKTWASTEVPVLTDIDAVSWAPQSDRLLVLTHTRLPDLGPSTAGWIVSANTPSEQKKIESLPETTRRAVWMHHSERLALFAQCKKDAPPGCSDLFTFDLAGAKLRNLTDATTDITLESDTLFLTEDDRSALISVTRGMKQTVAQVNLDSGQTHLLDLGLPVISGLHPDPHAKAFVYLASASTSAPAVFMTNAIEHPGQRLTQPETIPADWKAAPSRPVSWKRAGFTIEGLLYLPAKSGPAHIPLIVNVHGGPTGQFTDTYSPLTNLLVGQGWAVFVTNPRGSTGYGVKFEAANKDDMGNGDYLDIMAGVDEVLHTHPVDEERMALIGYSYGGEMAGFVEGKTTRFSAIVSGAPVIDQFSEYGTESDSFGDRWFTGEPWRHFESAWRQSPLAYAEHAKTPFLLLQGETDTTDPEGQSQEMYRALRQEGVPVQMLLFPREDHAALAANFAGRPSTEPWHGVIARDHMIRFINDAFAGKVEPNQP